MIWLDFSVNDTGTPPVAPANNPTSGSLHGAHHARADGDDLCRQRARVSPACPAPRPANSSTLTVNTSGPAVGEKVYLKFLTGGFPDGVYAVASRPNSSSFTVTLPTAAGATAIPGPSSCRRRVATTTSPSRSGTTPSTITIATNSNTNLNVGDHVWIAAGSAAQLKDAEWTVASVIDERHFTVTNTTIYTAETNQGVTIYPLVAPPLTRSGNVVACPPASSTWATPTA